jgi:outer membrane receptor protein involved in Fe transport
MDDTARSRRLTGATLGALAFIALMLAPPACFADAPVTHHFDVPAGNAAEKLNEFSRQAELQVLFNFPLVNSMRTNPVCGDLEARHALTLLLEGTGLVFDFVNERTLAVTLAPRSIMGKLWRLIKPRPVPKDLSGITNDEVLITASKERNRIAAPVGANILTFSREDIDNTGFATVPQLVARALPQNWGGGPTEDTVLGREAQTNSSISTGMNLRGAGSGSTLVLIDGRRMAPSGTAGAFTDVSHIPLTALDHMDVILAGGSTRYGADALGGVVNFVMRQDFSGAETKVQAGHVTDGALGERQLSQLFGTRWESGNGLLAIEYYERDALPARDRSRATNDLRRFGGDDFSTPFGNPGTLSVGGQTWAIPHGQDGTALCASDLVAGTQNLYDRYVNTDILPAQQRWSVVATARHATSETRDIFVDTLIGDRKYVLGGAATGAVLTVPRTNPFYVNPTGGSGPISVLYGVQDDLGQVKTRGDVQTANAQVGTNWEPGGGWKLTGQVSFAYEKEYDIHSPLLNLSALAQALADPDPRTAFNPFGDGSHTNPATLAAIRSDGVFRMDSVLRSENATAEGPLLRMPGGDVRLAAGFERRDQSFKSMIFTSGSVDASLDLTRGLSAAFAELRVPVFGPQPLHRGWETLELSIGTRREDYSGLGGTTTPNLGFVWSPAAGIVLRGTWARSVRPPNLPDLVEATNTSALRILPDPSSASGTTPVLVWAGNSADLREESSKSWTLGAEIVPGSLRDTSVALTYFDIESVGRVEAGQLSADALTNPAFPGLIIRDPTSAERGAVCARSKFLGDPALCTSAAIGAIVDIRLHNMTMLTTRGLDLTAKYGVQTFAGRFRLGLNGTYILDYCRAQTPNGPSVSLLNTQTSPLSVRLRGALSWQYRGFGVAAFIDYSNSYRDVASRPMRSVPHWATMDLSLSYDVDLPAAAWLAGTRIALSAQNVFNSDPPFVNNAVGIGYDQENADLLNRFIDVSLRKRW